MVDSTCLVPPPPVASVIHDPQALELVLSDRKAQPARSGSYDIAQNGEFGSPAGAENDFRRLPL